MKAAVSARPGGLTAVPARTGSLATALGLSAALVATTFAAPAQAQSRFESMDVFQLEYAADPEISPDGSQVVYVRTAMDIMRDRKRSELWVINADGSDHRRLATGGSPRWSPDGTRIAYTADGQIHLRWMDTGETATLTQLLESPSGIRWSPDGRHIAFNMLVPYPPPSLVAPPKPPAGADWADPPIMEDRFKSRQDGVGYLDFGYNHIFVIPVEGGTPVQVTSGDFQHSSPAAWLPDGTHVVFTSNRNQDWVHDYRNSEIYIASLLTGQIRALTDRPGPDNSPVVSPDGRRIAFVGYEDRTRTYQVSALQVMNLDGSGDRVVTGDLDRSVANPVWASDGNGLYFQYDDEGNSKVAFATLDGEIEVLADDLGGTSYGRPYGGGSFSVASNGAFALNQTRTDMPGELAVRVPGGDGPQIITALNDDLLAGKTLGEVEEIWWESSFDGRPVQGWIVKPPDFDPNRRYPFILEIHGGPVSNYGDRFSAEMQLMASAGYVVLYANPRGSTSYGEEFADLLFHNYPGQDYDDLISGVDAVIERGYIDEDNLFVTGGSAGGIMTAWIVGKTDRFRAAVAQKPVVNWISKTLTADNWYGYYFGRYEGLPWENPDAYWKFSPLSLAGEVETPTMIITGEEDLRTPLSESYQLYHALKLRGIDTAVIRLPGASHDHEPQAQPADGQDREHCGVVRQVQGHADGELSEKACCLRRPPWLRSLRTADPVVGVMVILSLPLSERRRRGTAVSSTINVKTLRHELGRIVERVKKGEHFLVLYRSRPAFRIVPLQGALHGGGAEDDSLFEADAVGRSTDGLTSEHHDRILYGESRG